MKYDPRLHIVLHNPEIPQNTGTIGRTCVALQAKLWLVRPLGFRVDEKHVRRAGLDYWQYLEWETADHWEDLKKRLPNEHYWYFSRFGKNDFRSVQYSDRDVFVFGSETAGLPDSITADQPENLLRIPTRPEVRSLNLATAVAIAGYECERQVGPFGTDLDG